MKHLFRGKLNKYMCALASLFCFGAHAGSLPGGFVYLKNTNSGIVENLRYHTAENFLGKKVTGYSSNRVILTEEAAAALHKAQAMFYKDGYSLVVYDAYRPARAVRQFVNWSKSSEIDDKEKKKYFPRIEHAEMLKLGYIYNNSKHSLGSTVDVTIIKRGVRVHRVVPLKRVLQDGTEIKYLDDGTVDMGSSFDLFDEVSHFESSALISQKQQANRLYLRNVMNAAGFEAYDKEWWHFTLRNEPFDGHHPFDFEVK